MEIRNTAGTKDLRDAARLNVFNMRDRFERGQFSSAQIAYYMYVLSECAADTCEMLLNEHKIQGIVQEMIHSPYGKT